MNENEDVENQSADDLYVKLSSLYSEGADLKMRFGPRKSVLREIADHMDGPEVAKIRIKLLLEKTEVWQNSAISNLCHPILPRYFSHQFVDSGTVLPTLKFNPSGDISEDHDVLKAFEVRLGVLARTIDKVDTIRQKDRQPNSPARNRAIRKAIGDIQLMDDGMVTNLGTDYELPPQQRRLAEALILAEGMPVSRSTIIDALWNEETNTEGYLEDKAHSVEEINGRISNIVSELNQRLRTLTDRKRHVVKVRGQTATYKIIP